MSFAELGDQGRVFSIGELKFSVSFWSATSISFDLQVGVRHGWIDVHFPCQGHIKTRIRCAVPTECVNASNIRELIPEIFRRLRIASDETFEAEFFKQNDAIRITQPVDRHGTTDRIETIRDFKIPPD